MGFICLVAVCAVVGAYVGVKGWTLPGSKTPSWQQSILVDVPAELVREAVNACFGKSDRMTFECGTLHLFQRGSWRAGRDLRSRGLRLEDLPLHFSVGVTPKHGNTEIMVQFDIESNAGYRGSMGKRFDAEALVLIGRVFEQLRRTVHRLDGERSAKKPDKGPEGAVSQEDYGALGLDSRATPEQIHAAYRDACRKYHPDRLAARSLEPHLVELAVQRFKEATAAYQRLRVRLEQPKHA